MLTVSDKTKYAGHRERRTRLYGPWLPEPLLGSIGAIAWAIRGTSGWGGIDGTIIPGMTWGLLSYYLCHRNGIDARSIPTHRTSSWPCGGWRCCSSKQGGNQRRVTPMNASVRLGHVLKSKATIMKNIIRLLAFTLVIAGARPVHAQPDEPPPAKLKAAAEAGDAQAQSKLGDAYRSQFAEATALIWYRKAAAQGVVHAQSELGRILMSHADSPFAKPEAQSVDADEAIEWYLKAANQGDKVAQLVLGQQFEAGKFVKQDYIEAYKWFAIAAEGANPFDIPTIGAKRARDAIILIMTQDQLTEGRKRVVAFTPGHSTKDESPEPVWVQKIKLQGLSGAETHRLAVINGKAFQKGEELEIKVGGKTVKIRCLDVGKSSATIAIKGRAQPRELKLTKD
jgi:hypothetical protein